MKQNLTPDWEQNILNQINILCNSEFWCWDQVSGGQRVVKLHGDAFEARQLIAPAAGLGSLSCNGWANMTDLMPFRLCDGEEDKRLQFRTSAPFWKRKAAAREHKARGDDLRSSKEKSGKCHLTLKNWTTILDVMLTALHPV